MAGYGQVFLTMYSDGCEQDDVLTAGEYASLFDYAAVTEPCGAVCEQSLSRHFFGCACDSVIASIDGNTDVFLEDIALMRVCTAHCVIRYVYDVFGRFWRATEQEVQPGRIGLYLYGECHG